MFLPLLILSLAVMIFGLARSWLGPAPRQVKIADTIFFVSLGVLGVASDAYVFLGGPGAEKMLGLLNVFWWAVCFLAVVYFRWIRRVIFRRAVLSLWGLRGSKSHR
jgi:hypothetical protein